MDPLSFAAIGGVVLAEGIKFLMVRRVNCSADSGSDRLSLGRLPVRRAALFSIVTRERRCPAVAMVNQLARTLQDLRDELEPNLLARPRLETDRPLPQDAALREALEAFCGRRLTFMGEPRERSGAVITGTARVKMAKGLAAGVGIDDLTGVDEVHGIVDIDIVRAASLAVPTPRSSATQTPLDGPAT